jgi:hypothetical protein
MHARECLPTLAIPPNPRRPPPVPFPLKPFPLRQFPLGPIPTSAIPPNPRRPAASCPVPAHICVWAGLRSGLCIRIGATEGLHPPTHRRLTCPCCRDIFDRTGVTPACVSTGTGLVPHLRQDGLGSPPSPPPAPRMGWAHPRPLQLRQDGLGSPPSPPPAPRLDSSHPHITSAPGPPHLRQD